MECEYDESYGAKLRDSNFYIKKDRGLELEGRATNGGSWLLIRDDNRYSRGRIRQRNLLRFHFVSIFFFSNSRFLLSPRYDENGAVALTTAKCSAKRRLPSRLPSHALQPSPNAVHHRGALFACRNHPRMLSPIASRLSPRTPQPPPPQLHSTIMIASIIMGAAFKTTQKISQVYEIAIIGDMLITT
ncbi:hypothetical protein Ahy_B06g084521 isoform B [Arachis hypogaea]|uniref:Uncharacterized protein n=1 Tax=Arachis hypogaea TaxID=3818 RepID=A0A444YS54_ARAHY|nr:hypothetical protein Ahy_B06g084521 isoform B [Arachis hypogaea]